MAIGATPGTEMPFGRPVRVPPWKASSIITFGNGGPSSQASHKSQQMATLGRIGVILVGRT